jgi:TRAP-type C4-dicarboxylate transport system permease small subunit
MFSKLCRVYARICFGACELALTAMLLIVVYEVISRYIFGSPTQYSLEITEYLLVSIGILPLAVILNQGRHVNVDALVVRLSETNQARLKILCRLLTVIFALVVVYFGTEMSLSAFITDSRSSSLLAFPLGVAYAIIPVGFLSLALSAFDEAIQTVKSMNTEGAQHE